MSNEIITAISGLKDTIKIIKLMLSRKDFTPLLNANIDKTTQYIQFIARVFSENEEQFRKKYKNDFKILQNNINFLDYTYRTYFLKDYHDAQRTPEMNPADYSEIFLEEIKKIEECVKNIYAIFAKNIKEEEELVFNSADGQNIKIELYINTKSMNFKKDKVLISDYNRGFFSNNINTITNALQAFIENNDFSKLNNGDIALNGSASIKVYKKAKLNGSNGTQHTRIIFFSQKYNDTIRVFLCEYIAQGEHNDSIGKKNSNNIYAKIDRGDITKDSYVLNGVFQQRDISFFKVV